MNYCDACHSPGSCCKGFVLNVRFNRDAWLKEATERMAQEGVEYFVPVRLAIPVNPDGKVSVAFNCLRLGQDGRCTDYENRPPTCREFLPYGDPLCALYIHRLKEYRITLSRN